MYSLIIPRLSPFFRDMITISGVRRRNSAPPDRRGAETVEKVAMPLFRGRLHESFPSISCEIVGEAFVRSVISEVHAPGNDGIQFYFVAISALSAAALRRLRSETRLRAQFGQRNSLQEGFFDKLRAPDRFPVRGS